MLQTYLENKEPNTPNWYNTSGLQSAFAPTSSNTLTPPSSLGINAARGGLKIPGIALLRTNYQQT